MSKSDITIYALRDGSLEFSNLSVQELPKVTNQQIAQTCAQWADRPLFDKLTIRQIKQLYQIFILRDQYRMRDITVVFEDLHLQLAWDFFKDCTAV